MEVFQIIFIKCHVVSLFPEFILYQSIEKLKFHYRNKFSLQHREARRNYTDQYLQDSSMDLRESHNEGEAAHEQQLSILPKGVLRICHQSWKPLWNLSRGGFRALWNAKVGKFMYGCYTKPYIKSSRHRTFKSSLHVEMWIDQILQNFQRSSQLLSNVFGIVKFCKSHLVCNEFCRLEIFTRNFICLHIISMMARELEAKRLLLHSRHIFENSLVSESGSKIVNCIRIGYKILN